MKDLLLLHGALSTQKQFDEFANMLSADYKIHTLTFRGHGNNTTPLSGNYFDDYAEDILHYLLQNQLTKINIFGYSMGGYAALYFATKYPNMVENTATLNTKFNWQLDLVGKETALLNGDKITEKVPAYAQQLMQLHGDENWKTVLTNTKTMMEQLAKQPLLTPALLANITGKVLIGVGDNDNTTSIEENLAVFNQLQQANFMVMPNTKHPFDKVDFEVLAIASKRFFD